MKKFLIIIIITLSNPLVSEEFKLICSESNLSYDSNLSSSFSKIINFKSQTLTNYSGGFFDSVVLFGRSQIILKNQVFNTRSTFNIKTNKWITYKGQFVKIYECTKEKRRF